MESVRRRTRPGGCGCALVLAVAAAALCGACEFIDGPGFDQDTFAGGAARQCIPAPEPGEMQVECEGLVFDVSLPEQCPRGGCGLVVDVHGLTMNAAMEDANTNMRELGRERGYVVVQPNADGEPPLTSIEPADDDTIRDFVAAIVAVWDLDRDRVHFTGFSQGGYMTWRMLCDQSGLFASVAPAAAAAGEGCADQFDALIGPLGCLLGEAGYEEGVDILYMHGTKDVMVPFRCAENQRADVLATLGMGAAEIVSSGPAHRWSRYRNAAGTVFELIDHDFEVANPLLGGHCFPGSRDRGGLEGQLFPFACDGTQPFSWGEAVMDFFVAHPRD